MLERSIEKKLMLATERNGGVALKLSSPGNRGVPDRLCLFPGGRSCFVEVKAPGKKPEPLQAFWHEKLRALGFDVRVIDSLEQADAF